MNQYSGKTLEELCEGSLKRVIIRRSMRPGELDRIADTIEALVERLCLCVKNGNAYKQLYEDCMNEKSQQEKMYGKQQQG